MAIDLGDIDVVILCGGLGKRLKPVVSDRPKALAEIGNRAFLDILIESLLKQGFQKIMLCVGHQKEQIKDYCNTYEKCRVTYSEEDEPLGTGGALKNAKRLIRSNPFIVMNGDSICKLNFRKFVDFHVDRGAVLSMLLSKTVNAQDYGTVVLDESQKILSFREKVKNANEYLINAGVYLMQKDIFSIMPNKKHFSLEYDLFPKLTDYNCYGFPVETRVIDIGTPDRYKNAFNLIGGTE